MYLKENAMKYERWLLTWLENYVKPAVKRRTYEKYREITALHLVNELGEYELDALTPARLQNFTVGLLSCGNLKNSGGLHAATVNCIITVIQHSLKTAYAVGEVNAYTGDRIQRPAVRKKEINCFTIDEQKKIERAVFSKNGTKMYGVVLCMYTGLRIGELLALEKCDVDMDKRTIRVNKSCRDCKDGKGRFTRCVDTPKTPSSIRLIPIPAQLMGRVKELLTRSDGDYLINSNGENPLAVRSYQRSFELLLKKLGIEHRGFHALRHTFATRALECGMDVKTLSEILGHKNPSTTLLHYAHSLDEHKNAMMNRVGELFCN